MTFSLGTRLLIALVSALAISLYAYRAGSEAKDTEWWARINKQAQDASDRFVKEVKRGDAAVVAAQKEKKDTEVQYADLAVKHAALRKRIPLMVAPAGAPDPGGAADRQASTPRGVEQPARLQPSLSLGAVWLWNSALAGRADVYPSACGTDGGIGGPAPACAAASGLTLDDAFDNQAENARRAARNKARLDRLNKYLKAPSQ